MRNNLDQGLQTQSRNGQYGDLQQQGEKVNAGRGYRPNSQGQVANSPAVMLPQTYDFVVPQQKGQVDNSIGFKNSRRFGINDDGRGRRTGGGGMGGGQMGGLSGSYGLGTGDGAFGNGTDDADTPYDIAGEESGKSLRELDEDVVPVMNGVPPAAEPQADTTRLGDRIVLGMDVEGKSAEGYLTSLEIELPERGIDYFFSSPRGNAAVTVRPLVSKTFLKFESAMILFGICLGVWAVVSIGQRVEESKFLRVCAIVGLALAGLISVLSLTLPLYGLLAIGAAIALSIRAISNSQQKPLAAE